MVTASVAGSVWSSSSNLKLGGLTNFNLVMMQVMMQKTWKYLIPRI
jgi:hypothetical protein